MSEKTDALLPSSSIAVPSTALGRCWDCKCSISNGQEIRTALKRGRPLCDGCETADRKSERAAS